MSEELIKLAAEAIANAEGLVITAGAGMGVDSGLPDFRGPEGFWSAYPAYRDLGLKFSELATPWWFVEDPALAWGFYGHRLNLYRATSPHAGFEILRQWSTRMKKGAFVFTSNVDGHFQRVGFSEDQVTEIHGSIHYAQCMKRCGVGIFPADSFVPAVDGTTFRCEGELPKCPACGALARPNILMFGDYGWDPGRNAQQEHRLDGWLRSAGPKLVVVELGAGTSVPTVRTFSEGIAEARNARLVRINIRQPKALDGGISLPMGALNALEKIKAALTELV